MSKLDGVAVVFTFATVIASAACTTETSSTEESPSVASDGQLDEQDDGTSYNGWTQSVAGTQGGYPSSTWTVNHTLSRSSGDLTRGGGACGVVMEFAYGYPTYCTADTGNCVALAQSRYGSLAYGYCVQNNCYSRPGSQSTYCALNPNRSPGTLTASGGGTTNYLAWGLGCMTKTVGPNTACGGTDTTKYMRTTVYLPQ